MIPVKVTEKQVLLQYSHQRWFICLVSLISVAMIHTFFIFSSSVSSSPAAWLMLRSRGRNRWRTREGLGLHPSAHQTVYGTAAPFHRREGDRWVGCCCSRCCWMTHANPDSNSVTHQSHHGDFAQIWGRLPCYTGVAPAVVSPLPHRGEGGSNFQQTATSASDLLNLNGTHCV